MSSKLKRCDEIVKEYDVDQLVEKYLQIEHEYQTVMTQVELPMTNIHKEFL